MTDKLRDEQLHLILDWIESGETSENYYTGKDSTSAEKEQIRQSRLEYFLPHLKREFPEFQERLKGYYSHFKWGTKVRSARFMIFTYLLINIIWYSTFYDWGMFSATLGKLLSPDNILVQIVELVEYTAPISFAYLYDWILHSIVYHKTIGRLGYPTESEIKNIEDNSYIYKGLPYIEAFMIANGFISKTAMKNFNFRTLDVPPSKIASMNFNEFIEFVKINFESEALNYDTQEWVSSKSAYEYVIFDCIFFYQNQETLIKNHKERLSTKNSILSEYRRLTYNPNRDFENLNYGTVTTSYSRKPSYSTNKRKMPKGCTIQECMEESIKMEMARKILDID